MSIRDEIAAEVQHVGGRCTLADFLATLPPADADEIRAAIVGREFPIAAVHRYLLKRGLHCAASTISLHHHGRCATCRTSTTP